MHESPWLLALGFAFQLRPFFRWNRNANTTDHVVDFNLTHNEDSSRIPGPANLEHSSRAEKSRDSPHVT